jgi:ketosteroid isomerase-like protein
MRRAVTVVLCLGILAAAAGSAPGWAAGAGEGSGEQVREARERFNAAIAERDLEAIGSVLAPDLHVVTGRGTQYHGKPQMLAVWQRIFAEDPTLIYQRTPREIQVNEAWGLAEEVGDWTGSYTVGGEAVRSSGRYAAKWQRAQGGEWVLTAELFTTLACDGPPAGCPPPAPIE